MTYQLISTTGLLLDILGVIAIWRYGLPPEVSRGGIVTVAMESYDADEAAKEMRYNLLSRCGLVALVVGFGLQILAVWVR